VPQNVSRLPTFFPHWQQYGISSYPYLRYALALCSGNRAASLGNSRKTERGGVIPSPN
jgi:hypothetical protein